MIETKQSLDIKAAVASLKSVLTHDGVYIVVDPDGVSASGRSKADAVRRLREDKAGKLS